jgi:hypothetical protein
MRMFLSPISSTPPGSVMLRASRMSESADVRMPYEASRSCEYSR